MFLSRCGIFSILWFNKTKQSPQTNAILFIIILQSYSKSWTKCTHINIYTLTCKPIHLLFNYNTEGWSRSYTTLRLYTATKCNIVYLEMFSSCNNCENAHYILGWALISFNFYWCSVEGARNFTKSSILAKQFLFFKNEFFQQRKFILYKAQWSACSVIRNDV